MAVPAAENASTPVVRADPIARATQAGQTAPATESAIADPQAAFLVHADSGEVLVRWRSGSATRVLIAHADLVLYDPALELVWYTDGDRLLVFDLRAPHTPAVAIFNGMAEVSQLTVTRGDHTVFSPEECDSPFAVLEWSADSKLKFVLAQPAGTAQLVGQAWLRAQLERQPRKISSRAAFTEARIKLPRKVLACDDAELCGTTVPFGARGWQLVLVSQQEGGDCGNRGCILHDPAAKQFAAPLAATTWGSAAQAARGPCGLYNFDAAQSAFLVGRMLCPDDATCQELGGQALGWLQPGARVGDLSSGAVP
jgi:hypothetical protein